MAFQLGGQTYAVNASGADITGFDPSRDRLDFGDISVHGLILGKLVDGTAVLVNPWQDSDYQRILDHNGNGISWNQLTLENFAPVGNEHLREDIGGVMSWELGIGPRNADTVYIRSHEYGVHERLENFDPQTQKLNFLYLGTRERLSLTDTDEGLLISVDPSSQSLLLVGVKRTDLYAGNLEFHFDQVMEDNLEEPFGVAEVAVSLVSRELLLTPQSIGGATTDGYQVRSGQLVQAAETLTINEVDHSMHHSPHHNALDHSAIGSDMSTGDAVLASNGSLSLEVSGYLYWGGMSGKLTLTNCGNTDLDGWSVSFVTPHTNFQSWAGDAQIESLADGTNRITLTPASWNKSIAIGQNIEVSFNAQSVGLPNSGSLNSELFFADGQTQMPSGGITVEAEPMQPQESETSSTPTTTDFEPETGTNDDAHLLEVSSMAIANGSKRIVGYFEEWGIYSRDFLVQDINVEDLTHINYSFFDVKANGDVNLFDSWAATDKRYSAEEQVSRTFSADEWAALDDSRRSSYTSGSEFTTRTNGNGSVSVSGVPVGWDVNGELAGNLRQFALLKQLNPDINLGLALGGWTLSDEFSLAFDDVAGRERFTDNVISTLETYDFFNTVDFDWEYPGGGGLSGNASSDQDGANFAATLKVLRQKMDLLETRTGEDYEISIATAGGQEKLANLNLPAIDAYVDFYNVMTYDFHGGWESVTGHQAAMTADAGGYDVVTAIQQFRNAGIAPEKVVLGAPTYTRAWGGVDSGEKLGYGELGSANSAPGSYEAGNYDQKDLVTGINNGSYDLAWDDDSKAAYLYNDQEQIWSSIETPSTIAGKAAYVDAAELGGMMFWALSSDSSGEQSLIGAASDLLRGGVSPDLVIARSPGFDVVFGGDGQFNISDFTTLA
ncbi:glycosyl hydrolase family 18 protein [Prochlorococcus sp. MIT 1306]|uniref:glycosyl hydrolase family 18 protein n=1 Tax=Prochlorococcus sp. MIT 1306 TaxID=1799667 RepID=UPI0007B38395|nr:glycosyl hydrolase family 18 protein [Prochlorococcus sp. MIT 1306]KZR66261.1 Chitinase A1 precursor [Prochlorococcus sp. MIT 1306]